MFQSLYLHKRLHAQYFFSEIPILIAILVVSGWVFDIDLVKSIIPGFTTMKPHTAINFIILGCWARMYASSYTNNRKLLKVLALVFLVSVAFLLLTFQTSKLGTNSLPLFYTFGNKSIAPASILNFSLLGVTLFSFLKGDKFFTKLAQALSIAVLYVSLIYLCGYMFNLNSLIRSSVVAPMALHTALCFISISGALLLANKNEGLLKHVFAQGLGGDMARRVLPLILVIPFIVGYLRLIGQENKLYNTEFGTAIHVVTISLICGICLTYYSKLLNKIDHDRKEIDFALRKSESTFASVFNSSEIGIGLVDPSGKWLKANAALCKILGYTEAELLQDAGTLLIDSDDLKSSESLYKQILNGELSTYNQEKALLDKAGKAKWILLTVSSVTDDQKKVLFLINQVIDITERKKTESELQRTLSENQKILDTSLDIICTLDKEGHFLQVSKASETVWGYKPSQLIGKSAIDFVVNEDKEISNQVIRSVKAGNPVTHFENRYIKKDQSIVPVVWSVVWSKDEQKFFGIAKDGSEKKRLEIALENERRRFKDLFLQAPSCIAVLEGPEFIFKTANPLYEKLTGKSNVVGHKYKNVFPELENQGFYQLLEQVYQTGELYSAKESLARLNKNNDGILVDTYFDFVFQPYRSATGRVQGIFIFANEVTAQVEGRQKVEESERKYRQLIEEMPGAVYTCDAKGRLMYYNKAASELWGREPQVGEDYWCGSFEIYDKQGNLLPLETSPMALTIKNGLPVKGVEMVISKPDGELRDVQPNPFPLFDADGKLSGAINMLIDITSHKKAEEKLKFQQEALQSINEKLTEKNHAVEEARKEVILKAQELERISKYKSEFLANMSHELRTPLNSVLVLAALLSENPEKNLTAKQLEYADIIHRSGSDLLTLINDILDLAKIEAGKLDISEERVALRYIAQDMEQTFSPIAREKGIHLNISLSENVPNYVHTDKLRLEQIIKNLLSNALKFTATNGTVTLLFGKAENQQLEITVSDTGIGIEKDKLKIIFEAFQQANGSTTRRFGGTGLGLSISRQLARMLNGKLSVESELGLGSSFSLFLPLEDLGETGPIPTEARDILSESQAVDSLKLNHLAGCKVLIVDDDVRNIYVLSAILAKYDIDFYSAPNGVEAIKQVEKRKDIDIILMDMMMPEMDGYQAMKIIRQNQYHKKTPIIALTAKAMTGDAEKCIEAGASDYLAKPFDTKHLLSQLNYWMATKKQWS